MIGAYNISEELISWLETTFPNQIPSEKDCTLEQLRVLQGHQEVINVIKATYQESLDDVYDTNG
tara:strand:- start:377 stop:568 length:192 start_codon:yes stop_codon:yes gene_type:complete